MARNDRRDSGHRREPAAETARPVEADRHARAAREDRVRRGHAAEARAARGSGAGHELSPSAGLRRSMAVALMTAERTDRRARHLEILNEVARIATLDLELRPMLQRITDTLAHKFDWEFVALITVNQERTAFLCEAVTTSLPTDVHVGYSRPLGSGIVGTVAATERPL